MFVFAGPTNVPAHWCRVEVVNGICSGGQLLSSLPRRQVSLILLRSGMMIS